MSIRSRVTYWLRGELNAMFGPDSWPRDPSTVRRQAGSASTEHEPSAGRQSRTRRSNTGAGQALDPVLARYYANLELPYRHWPRHGALDLEAVGQEVPSRSSFGG